MVSPCLTTWVRMPVWSAEATDVCVVGGVAVWSDVIGFAAGAGGVDFDSVFVSAWVLVSGWVLAACCSGGTCGALLIIGTVPLLRATVHLSVSSPPALANGSVGLVVASGAFFSSRAVSVCFAGWAGFSMAFS